MEYLRAWGKLIHEKKQKQKISWHCPFKEKNISYYEAVQTVHTKHMSQTSAVLQQQ